MQLRSIGRRDPYQRPSVHYSVYHKNLLEKEENKKALNWLLNERKLDLETIKKFQVGANENGEIAIPIIRNGVLIDYKFRDWRGKRFYRTPQSETWAINEEAFSLAQEKGFLIIVEGEFDCMAVWQMANKVGQKLPVISGTGGVNGTTEWLTRLPENIGVYINVDNDEPGQKYARQLAERIGVTRCKNVILPTKDANDFIKEGHTYDEYLKLVRKGRQFDVPGVNKIVDVIDQLRNNPIQRYPVHLDRYNIHSKGGVVKNGLITIIAKPGTGKSSLLLNFLLHHADNGIPVLLVSLENEITLTIQKILEIKYKCTIDKFDDAMWEKVKGELEEYPFYVDSSKEINTTKKLSDTVRQAKLLYGIEIVGYDHVGMITSRKDELPEIARQMHEIRTEHGITLYLISHVRKSYGDKDQKMVTGDDIYGTAAFHQLSNVVLIIQNFGKGMELTIEKSRESRSHLRIPIIFNGETGEIKDDMSRKVKFFDQEVEDVERLTPFVVTEATDEEPRKPEGLEDIEY